MAYGLVEPFGSPVIDQAAARVISSLLAPHVKQGTRLETRDFIPDRRASLFTHLEDKRAAREEG